MKRMMQTTFALCAPIAGVLALAATSTVIAAETTAAPSRVQVLWAPTEQLTEVKDNRLTRGWLRPADWEKSLGEHLRKSADRLLPPGEQLQVTVNDIKLAGAFEPWHGPNSEDIRFMKDVYPPRLDLHYKLLASDGATIREGDAKLWDGAYLQRALPIDSSDPLRFDKRMIDDWLRKEFRSAKTG